MRAQNRRVRLLMGLILIAAFLACVTAGGLLLRDSASAADFAAKNLPPCPRHPFGTDWMGRDMFARTVAGLSLSIRIGVLTAAVSAAVAFVLGTFCAVSKAADAVVRWLIDLVMGIPHILLLILISFACGRGIWGVVAGVSLTHWPALARVIRGEALQLRESTFIRAAKRLGCSRARLVFRHMAPHLLPQFLVGLILTFPHAILHEASVTFLGFGFSPEQPAVGVILSESMKYLAMGRWWLAVFPGALLVAIIVLFDAAGNGVRRLVDPASAHE